MEDSQHSPENKEPKHQPSRPNVSIVIPLFNEIENLSHLIEGIANIFYKSQECNKEKERINCLEDNKLTYEIICVDDGSQDGSTQKLIQLAQNRSDLKAIIFRKNYGQTAAIAAGFDYARGQVIVTLDGDLQNDPADIPKLLAKLNEGYDLVSGWRKNRQDDSLTRVLPSIIANWLIRQVTRVKVHDIGCSLKAYRIEIIADLNLYGEMHRFLPILAAIEGAKIAELAVNHNPRRYGSSKYGLGRNFRLFMDLLTVLFMKNFLDRPMYIFGFLGLLFGFISIFIGLFLLSIIFFKDDFISKTTLLLSILSSFAIIQILSSIAIFFSLGLLAELLTRTYHESQKRPIYRIQKIVQ